MPVTILEYFNLSSGCAPRPRNKYAKSCSSYRSIPSAQLGKRITLLRTRNPMQLPGVVLTVNNSFVRKWGDNMPGVPIQYGSFNLPLFVSSAFGVQYMQRAPIVDTALCWFKRGALGGTTSKSTSGHLVPIILD